MRYCDGCGGIAGTKREVPDPRRGEGEKVEVFFCSDECEQDILDSLERKARVARLVN